MWPPQGLMRTELVSPLSQYRVSGVVESPKRNQGQAGSCYCINSTGSLPSERDSEESSQTNGRFGPSTHAVGKTFHFSWKIPFEFRSNFFPPTKKNLFRLGSGVLYRAFEIALFSVPVKSISSNVTRSRNAGYALEAQTLLVRKKKKTTFARLRNFFITAFHLAYFFVVLSNNSIYPNFLFSYELSSFSQGCSTTNWYS